MTHRSLKSVQSFEYKLTLNCNAETIRLYFWKTSYNDPTDNDVTKYKELISLVRAFLYARNEKLQVTQEINDCEVRIKRRTDRIIKKAPTNGDNIPCPELKCTIKLNRQDETVRIIKYRAKLEHWIRKRSAECRYWSNNEHPNLRYRYYASSLPDPALIPQIPKIKYILKYESRDTSLG